MISLFLVLVIRLLNPLVVRRETVAFSFPCLDVCTVFLKTPLRYTSGFT